MREFKGGASVVIQTSHQALIFNVGDRDSIQNTLDLFVVCAAGFVEKFADGGERVDDGLVFGNLAVEDSQRIGDGAALAVNAHFRHYRNERLAECLVELRAIGGAAYGVQLQRPVGEAYAVEQGGQELKDLRVSNRGLAAGGRGADDFGVDLVELAVASFLRALAAKHGADREEFVQAALPEFVLDVSADDASSVFGTQRQRLPSVALSAAAIFPGEHLLGDDVGLFAYTAGK